MYNFCIYYWSPERRTPLWTWDPKYDIPSYQPHQNSRGTKSSFHLGIASIFREGSQNIRISYAVGLPQAVSAWLPAGGWVSVPFVSSSSEKMKTRASEDYN